jgi:hypothetical protein
MLVTAPAPPPAPPRFVVLEARLHPTASPGLDALGAGQRQHSSGELRDVRGRRVGRVAFTCVLTRVLPGGDAMERCRASARTPDGRLRVRGLSRRDATTHRWHLRGGSGAYRGARGSALIRDLSERDSLILLTVVGARPRAGAVRRPAANRPFAQRADARCADAARTLAALPPFPYPRFDPLHPDVALLPAVGAFLTGPGDPRPALRELDRRLTALGAPPARPRAWTALLQARVRALGVADRQDAAALAADAGAFARSAEAAARGYRRVAVTATVFGALRCVL